LGSVFLHRRGIVVLFLSEDFKLAVETDEGSKKKKKVRRGTLVDPPKPASPTWIVCQRYLQVPLEGLGFFRCGGG
jgi:hypothetical protein